MKYTFSVRPGFRVSGRVAKDVGSVMVALAKQRRYSPKALLEAARDPKSPAHQHFEWNNRKAAEAHRLAQARLYHRAIQYEFVINGKRDTAPIKMRVAYSVDTEQGRTHHSGSSVIKSRDLMERLMADAMARLESWRDQYAALRGKAELAGLFRELDRVVPRKRRKAA